MHEYPFDLTTVRLALVIGVIASMLFYEQLQLTSGGAIVPGYLALFLPAPLFIVMTLLTAYLTFQIVHRVIAKRYILYGRRKYELEILIGLLLISIWFSFAHFAIRLSPLLTALYGIGFVIPAVIAHDMSRQSPGKTLVAVLINTAIVGLFVFVFNSLSQIAPWQEYAQPASFGDDNLGYPLELLLPGVVASVVAGMLVFAKLGLRTGGFVMGAYLGLVLLKPLDLLFAVAVAAVTYLLVTRLLVQRLLIFGRRKLGMMLLIASIFGWAGELVLRALTQGQYVPWGRLNVITLMVPALIANDAQRQGLYRTLWGAGITAVAVFTTMNLLQAARLYVGA